MSLLFHAANTMMRHAVNRAVGARVKSRPEAFAKFKELVADEGFRALLTRAKADPKGKDARDVIGRVVGFVNLVAAGVPWSGRERAGELTKLMAVHRYAGPASLFYSVAPDPVHNLNVKAIGQSASVGWHLVGV